MCVQGAGLNMLSGFILAIEMYVCGMSSLRMYHSVLITNSYDVSCWSVVDAVQLTIVRAIQY